MWQTKQTSNQLQIDRQEDKNKILNNFPKKESIALVLIMMNGKIIILLIGFIALISDAWILDLERAQRTIEEIDREELVVGNYGVMTRKPLEERS